MSTGPVDRWIEDAPESEPLSELVEAHLGDHPLPVEDVALEAAVTRLEDRIKASSPRAGKASFYLLGALGMAASILLVFGWAARPLLNAEGPGPVASPVFMEPAAIDVRWVEDADPQLPMVTLREGARVLSSTGESSVVVLVLEGEVEVGGVVARAGQWALGTTDDEGTSTVVFPDGQAPPALSDDVWHEDVPRRLEAVRWESLPSRTLQSLDSILED